MCKSCIIDMYVCYIRLIIFCIACMKPLYILSCFWHIYMYTFTEIIIAIIIGKQGVTGTISRSIIAYDLLLRNHVSYMWLKQKLYRLHFLLTLSGDRFEFFGRNMVLALKSGDKYFKNKNVSPRMAQLNIRSIRSGKFMLQHALQRSSYMLVARKKS